MISIERRRELVDTDITLDGEPALIGGILNDFAGVRLLRNGLGCEFAWETVEHIVTNRSGEFRS